jgi:PAS domain S-box-containing protein
MLDMTSVTKTRRRLRRWSAPRFRQPTIGLRWRLVFLVVATLSPALLLFLHHTQNIRAELLAEAQSRALHLARSWAAQHDAILHEANLVLEAALRDPAIAPDAKERDTRETGGKEPCDTALTQLATRVGWPSALAMIDRDGTVLCTTERGDGILANLGKDYLAELAGSRGLEVSEFRLDRAGHSFAVAGLRLPASPGSPAPTKSGRMAVAAIDLAEIQRRTAREAAGTQFNLLVVGRAGNILARDPPDGTIGQRLGADHPLMPALQFHTEGSGEGIWRDGVDRIFAFTQLPQTGAKIAVDLAREDVLGAQEYEQNQVLLILGGVAILAIAGGWVLGEFSVVRWVVELGRAAEAFGRGDLERRAILPRAAGEFAVLAAAFNRMAATLAARRTALESANRALERHAEALAESERRFRDIADIAGDFFWERDPDGRYTFLSERFTEVTGVSADFMLGKSPEERADLVCDGADAATLEAAFDAHTPFRNLTLRMTLPSGAVRWWRMSGKPVVDKATGSFLGFRGSGNDVTAEQAAAEELRAAKDEAEAASRVKSEFLATMSHELRTPLNAIIGFSEIMAGEMLGPIGTAEYRGYARDILGSGRHLLALISDILDFVKAESGSLQLQDEAVDLTNLAQSVTRLLSPQAETAGLALSLEEPGRPVIVRGDERRLRQVLLNLAGNALKFTPSGGAVTVAVVPRSDGGTEIAVRDTGIGIAAVDLPHVMEPFRQVDGSVTRSQDGIGLGLAICDRLVRLHRGSLTLNSELGKGTVATIRLPPDAIAARVA